MCVLYHSLRHCVHFVVKHLQCVVERMSSNKKSPGSSSSFCSFTLCVCVCASVLTELFDFTSQLKINGWVNVKNGTYATHTSTRTHSESHKISCTLNQQQSSGNLIGQTVWLTQQLTSQLCGADFSCLAFDTTRDEYSSISSSVRTNTHNPKLPLCSPNLTTNATKKHETLNQNERARTKAPLLLSLIARNFFLVSFQITIDFDDCIQRSWQHHFIGNIMLF